jgi:TetR/AcrR family transcriptional regulator, repressor for neighboring sulfatase
MTTTSKDGPQAVGRDEVMAAVIDVAGQLFSQRGIEQVTIREIAKAAGVNHALVHRHFETKENVVHAVLQNEAKLFTDRITNLAMHAKPSDLFSTLGTRDRFWRILAYCMLANVDVQYLLADNSNLQRLTNLIDNQNPVETSPEARVCSAAALTLGWSLFQPFLTAATNRGVTPIERVQHEVQTAVSQLLGNPSERASPKAAQQHRS